MIVHLVAYAWLFGSFVMLCRVLMYSSRDFNRQTGLTKGRTAMPLIVQYVFPHYPLDNGSVEYTLSVKVFVAAIFFVFNIIVGVITSAIYPISIVTGFFGLLDAGYMAIRRRWKNAVDPANLKFIALMLYRADPMPGVERAHLYDQLIKKGETMTDEELRYLYFRMVFTANPYCVDKWLADEIYSITKFFENNRESIEIK